MKMSEIVIHFISSKFKLFEGQNIVEKTIHLASYLVFKCIEESFFIHITDYEHILLMSVEV